jgi:hypothetical protein
VVFKDVMLCFEEHISFVFRDDMEVILWIAGNHLWDYTKSYPT